MTDAHVKTIRLFDLARVRTSVRLTDWEKEHLDQCEECQGVLAVFRQQVKQTPTPPTPLPATARFKTGAQVKVTAPGPHSGKQGVVVDIVQPKAGDYVYRYRVSFPDGTVETFFGFELN